MFLSVFFLQVPVDYNSLKVNLLGTQASYRICLKTNSASFLKDWHGNILSM